MLKSPLLYHYRSKQSHSINGHILGATDKRTTQSNYCVTARINLLPLRNWCWFVSKKLLWVDKATTLELKAISLSPNPRVYREKFCIFPHHCNNPQKDVKIRLPQRFVALHWHNHKVEFIRTLGITDGTLLIASWFHAYSQYFQQGLWDEGRTPNCFHWSSLLVSLERCQCQGQAFHLLFWPQATINVPKNNHPIKMYLQ